MVIKHNRCGKIPKIIDFNCFVRCGHFKSEGNIAALRVCVWVCVSLLIVIVNDN